jgi:hypothetical protein
MAVTEEAAPMVAVASAVGLEGSVEEWEAGSAEAEQVEAGNRGVNCGGKEK